MMLTMQEIGKVRKSMQKDFEDRIPFVFQALSDTTRLKVVRLLNSHEDLCVTDIAKICSMTVSAISYQMKMLEVVGLVKKERMGKMICYELKKEDPLVKRILKIIQ
jgi:DNA-binding transcriptional ArsR family regulator